MLLFKLIRNIGPKYIRDFFGIRETSYNLRRNGVNLNTTQRKPILGWLAVTLEFSKSVIAFLR